jgi:dTDP-4-dehydrorhamnose reductase
MKVLITGAGGMLGAEVVRRFQQAGHTVIPTGRKPPLVKMDITDPQQVREVMEAHRPEVVIHCAAMTNVDACERRPEDAYRVNAFGTELIAAHCERIGAICVAISTDYLFDGSKGSPYHEYDAPNPLSVYGRSKDVGEQAVRALCPRHYIVRTAWLYGTHGKSFPHFILERVQAGEGATVIADQIGSPTFTADVADRLLSLFKSDCYGTYHLTNAGPVSRYEFALELLRRVGLPPNLAPIPLHQWQTPAPRPRYSALISWRLEWAGVPPMRPWREALDEFVKQMSGA